MKAHHSHPFRTAEGMRHQRNNRTLFIKPWEKNTPGIVCLLLEGRGILVRRKDFNIMQAVI